MNDLEDVTLTVGEFVALCNQTLEYAYPVVSIGGELANFRVSKGRWVFFDLKDEEAVIKCFGTVRHLPGPLEDGMLLVVSGSPRLSPQYGFSLNLLSIRPVGEGSIKKAAKLLEKKLTVEGLFDPARKRALPYPPRHIGLITSAESAAYHDFIKVIGARWGGLHTTLIDVQVQGEAAPGQLTAAVRQFNQQAHPPDVIVITRGGGSAEDLQAFSTEQVTRAVAGSRIPTLVAIGHEKDLSLAELAADQRASTPSNAAELLVPDRGALLQHLHNQKAQLTHLAQSAVQEARQTRRRIATFLFEAADRTLRTAGSTLEAQAELLQAYNPQTALQRGYALARKQGKVIRLGGSLQVGDEVSLQFIDAIAQSTITSVTIQKEAS